MKVDNMMAKVSHIHNEVRTQLVESNAIYKATAYKNRRFKEFKEANWS